MRRHSIVHINVIPSSASIHQPESSSSSSSSTASASSSLSLMSFLSPYAWLLMTLLSIISLLPLSLSDSHVLVSAGGVGVGVGVGVIPPTPTRCSLTLPISPLSSEGLSRPWILSPAEGEGTLDNRQVCSQENQNTRTFVEAVILDTTTGQIQAYTPVVVTRGTEPAANIPVPRISSNAIVALWIYSEADTLDLVSVSGATSTASLDAAGCIEGGGVQWSSYGAIAHCNTRAFYQAVYILQQQGILTIPRLSRDVNNQACVNSRDFGIGLDVNMGGHVMTQYLLTSTGRVASNIPATRESLDNSRVGYIVIQSQTATIYNTMFTLAQCKTWRVQDLGDATGQQLIPAYALMELQAEFYQPTPQAYIPPSSPFAVANGSTMPVFDLHKLNSLRAALSQPVLSSLGSTALSFCENAVTLGVRRIQSYERITMHEPSPDPSISDNLYGYLVTRYHVALSEWGFNCITILGMNNYPIHEPTAKTPITRPIQGALEMNDAARARTSPNGTQLFQSTPIGNLQYNGQSSRAGSLICDLPSKNVWYHHWYDLQALSFGIGVSSTLVLGMIIFIYGWRATSHQRRRRASFAAIKSNQDISLQASPNASADASQAPSGAGSPVGPLTPRGDVAYRAVPRLEPSPFDLPSGSRLQRRMSRSSAQQSQGQGNNAANNAAVVWIDGSAAPDSAGGRALVWLDDEQGTNDPAYTSAHLAEPATAGSTSPAGNPTDGDFRRDFHGRPRVARPYSIEDIPGMHTRGGYAVNEPITPGQERYDIEAPTYTENSNNRTPSVQQTSLRVGIPPSPLQRATGAGTGTGSGAEGLQTPQASTYTLATPSPQKHGRGVGVGGGGDGPVLGETYTFATQDNTAFDNAQAASVAPPRKSALSRMFGRK